MVIKAKDIIHAEFLASNNYGYDKDQISIFTLKEPSVKLGGLFHRKGLYQIVEKEPPTDAQGRTFTYREGTAQIIKGQIFITDPVGNGRQPTVVIKDPNIEVYLNDQKIDHEFTASESDSIKLCPKVIPPRTDIEAIVSDDKMSVELIITREVGREYYAIDTEADNRILVFTGHKELPPLNPTLQQCIEVLESHNIKKEFLNIPEIEKSLVSGGSNSVTAAMGIPPNNGMNGKIKYLFAEKSYRNPDLLTDKKVDLLDHTIRPSVKEGEILAIKVNPATSGSDGYNVYGERISCRHGKDVELLAGDNVIIEDMSAIATINGRPYFKQGHICVNPVMLIDKDIDAKSGNVYFDGDIEIKGNVIEGVMIQAEGNIHLYGSVYDSVLNAKGSIRVYGNIISSQITAGCNVVENMIVLPYLEDILTILKNYSNEINSLKMAGNNVGKYLYQKFDIDKTLNKRIKELKDALITLKNDEPNKAADILTAIEGTLIGSNALHISGTQEINKICDDIKGYIDFSKSSYHRRSDISFESCQNSFIQANGNIVSTGKGSYSSKLIADRSIVFKKPDNIVRGGILVAGINIDAGTIGSAAGINTYCRVLSQQGKINSAEVHINTTLNVGGNIKIVK